MRITTISCSEDIFLQLTSPSSSSSVLFVPLPRFPRPRRGWYRCATLAENFAISYSKLFDCFRVSRFPGNKKLLCQRPRVVLICGYKHEYLEGIWPHLFSKAAVMSFPWGLWSSLVYRTQHMLSSAQGSGLRCHQEAWFPHDTQYLVSLRVFQELNSSPPAYPGEILPTKPSFQPQSLDF